MPPKSGRKMIVAILAVAMLTAGIVIGYFVPRPTPVPQAPGPVSGLDRANTIARVTGWYNGSDVAYLDYGVMQNVAIPILVFFQAGSPGTAVSGQKNIIDAIPGQPGYSDFWRVHKVLAPSNYVANFIRSFEDAVASGYPIEITDIIVNCPVVNPGATIQGSSTLPVAGWYRDREVFYFDHGANSPGDGFVVHDAPIYAFFDQAGQPIPGQRNVIDFLPGEVGYSDLWRVVMVAVGPGYMANSLRDAGDILQEQAMGNVTMTETDIYVNCPVVA